MRGDGGGASLVSALSHTTSSDIANVFAAMLLNKQPSVYVGLFGDKLLQYKVDRTKGILAMANPIRDNVMRNNWGIIPKLDFL